jgi:hypothetical protein
MPRQSTFNTAEYQALIIGLQKYCATSTFPVGGQSLTTPQVVALITAILNAALAVPPAKAAWLATVTARDAVVEQDGETVEAVRDLVAIQFKNAPTTLADFAITPRKAPKPLTAEARVVAKAKAQATREARGTGSKKEKAAITGNVTGVTITPTTTPAAPAATPLVVNGSGAPAVGSTPHT